MVLNMTAAAKHYYQQEQAKKRQSIDNSMIRFPKLDECAHFHYEFAELNNFHVSLIINDNCASRQAASETADSSIINIRNLYLFVRVQSLSRSWTVRRNLQDFRFLDIQLHKCVFDRKHSKLQPLNLSYFSSFDSLESIVHFVAQYLDRLSQIVGGCFLTCGPVLHWFEIDNRGNRLINEESDINTPAIGAAFVIKKHNKSDVETEISLEIGELVSVIEMPPVNESFYWKGKKGFEVGFFPAECVQLIDDKISRKTEEFPLLPLNKCTSPTLLHRASDSSCAASVSDEISSHCGSNHLDPHHHHYLHQSVMRKHGLIAALFRTFASGGRRRDQLKRSGILKERVFGCDLCEHLANSGHDLPLVLTTCCAYIEANGLSSNGIYRLSGVASTINRLRAIFDEDSVPEELKFQDDITVLESDPSVEPLVIDIHAVSSLLKLYFRELPNPLLSFSLYDSFVSAMRDDSLDEGLRLQIIRSLVISLPPPHWRTLRFLIRHLSFVSKFDNKTGMTPKNLAIVWAPNLLRSRDLDQHVGIEALHVIGTQAVLTEFLILNCDKIFDREEHELHPPKPLYSPFIYSKHGNSSHVSSKCLKYIDVGPEIIPGKYHTIISIRPSSQSKRSKFNLQNWKKFHFFSTRSHNVRSRPSLFGDETITNSGGGNFRKLNNFDGHGRISSESANNFNHFHKAVSNCLSVQISKSVKRSQSFDSYFKKLRTSSSGCSNSKCCSSESDDGNHTMVDINRNQFEHLNKNDTIFEVEEMSIDCDIHIGEVNRLQHNEVNNNVPQINEEPIKLAASAISQVSAASDQSLQVQQMDTNCSALPSNIGHGEAAPINQQNNSTEPISANVPIEDQQCSLESKSLTIPATKSAPPHTSSTTAGSQPAEADSTNDADTHSPLASPTQFTASSTGGDDQAQIRVTQTETNHIITRSNMDSPTDTRKSLSTLLGSSFSDYAVMDEHNSSSPQSVSTHSSLNSVAINEPNLQSLESQSINTMDSDNVQSSDSSDSSSPTATLAAPTAISSISAPVDMTVTTAAAAPLAVDDSSARERIERIKEERRNQIRQNFIQQLAQTKCQDPRLSPSRIPIAHRSGGNNLPEVANSSDSSPVRLRNRATERNKAGYLTKAVWRNSEATMNDSCDYSSVSAKQNISECRRSVPNLELQVQSSGLQFPGQSLNSTLSESNSESSQPSPTSPSKGATPLEGTGSLSKASNTTVKYRRPPIASSISVEAGTGSGRAKIAVTPLRTINKRQRIIDPKTLAQMFEQQNSADKV